MSRVLNLVIEMFFLTSLKTVTVITPAVFYVVIINMASQLHVYND